jgi:hypothetical protein
LSLSIFISLSSEDRIEDKIDQGKRTFDQGKKNGQKWTVHLDRIMDREMDRKIPESYQANIE